MVERGYSGRFPDGKPAAAESRYPALINYKVHAWSFRVSVILHRTLTCRDYRIFNVVHTRDHSYAWGRGGGWGGVGHTDNESAWHCIFDSQSFSCAFDGVPTSGTWSLDLESDALPTEPPRHPFLLLLLLLLLMWLLLLLSVVVVGGVGVGVGVVVVGGGGGGGVNATSCYCCS